VELVFERIPGTAGAGAFGAAGLDHEIRDDAMEREAVIEAVFGELLEVGYCFRRFIVVELQTDIAVLGFDGGGFHERDVRGQRSEVRKLKLWRFGSEAASGQNDAWRSVVGRVTIAG
jgi:hypothetical protein